MDAHEAEESVRTLTEQEIQVVAGGDNGNSPPLERRVAIDRPYRK